MRFRVLIPAVLAVSSALAGCVAPAYSNPGPEPAAEPPKIILVRLVAVGDATEPESITLDGEYVCHNYNPARMGLPKCPNFDPEKGSKMFELEAYVPIGEHRVAINGWGEEYRLIADQLFLPGTAVTCEFDYSGIKCSGEADGDPVAELEALGADGEFGEPATPPSLDAPSSDEGSEPSETDEAAEAAPDAPVE